MKITTRQNNNSTPELSKRAAAVANQVAASHNLSAQHQSQFKAMLDEFLESFAPSMEAAAHSEATSRLKEILALPEAAERRATAERLALDTDTSVEQIKQILESVPVAKEETTDMLALAMAGKTPGISPDAGEPGEGASAESEMPNAEDIYSRRSQAAINHNHPETKA
jgi:hypothetical protein